MEHATNTSRMEVHSLLLTLAEGRGRHAALSALHERGLQLAGGRTSVLFEPHPTTNHLYPTSGAGFDTLTLEPWVLDGAGASLVAQAFAAGRVLPASDLQAAIPHLYSQLGTPHALLLPLSIAERRVGLLAIGVVDDPEERAKLLDASELPAGFALALELTRLQQHEAFDDDVRRLLDDFTQQVSATLDLRAALPRLCDNAARLFGADRMTIWLHDRVTHALEPLVSSDAGAADEPVRADDPLTPAAAALRAHGAGLALQPAGVTATLTVPLRGYRRALGTLVFEGVRIDPGEDLALLTRADALGRRLASAIETTQLLGALARSRRDLEGLFDAVPILLLVLDDSGAIVRANRAFAEAAQLEPAATAGTRLTGLISSDLDEWLRAAVHAPGDIQPRVFDEPRLGGRFTIAVHLIVQEGGRTLRVVSGQRLAAA